MKDIKELLKLILLMSLMIFSGLIVKNALAIFGIVYTPDNYFLYSVIDLLASALVIIFLLIQHRKTLKEDIRKILSNKHGLLKYLGLIVLGYIMLINLEAVFAVIERIIAFIFSINMSTPDNQEKVEVIIHSSPILMAISACLLAPIEEELLFRGTIRKTIKNKGVFIAVSGLFFGLLHITGNYILLFLLLITGFIVSKLLESKNKYKMWLSVITIVIAIIIFFIAMILLKGGLMNYFNSLNVSEIINGIVYVALGIYFASVYAYTDNIYYSIGIHLLTNGFATTLILLK